MKEAKLHTDVLKHQTIIVLSSFCASHVQKPVKHGAYLIEPPPRSPHESLRLLTPEFTAFVVNKLNEIISVTLFKKIFFAYLIFMSVIMFSSLLVFTFLISCIFLLSLSSFFMPGDAFIVFMFSNERVRKCLKRKMYFSANHTDIFTFLPHQSSSNLISCDF